jgi:hypothetical protein
MTSIGRLASYVALVGGLSYALVFSAIWLARPDPSIRAEAHAAPIPPRIAASIERRREALPAVETASAPAATEPAVTLAAVPLPPVRPEPEAPTMKEAHVSLEAVSLESVPLPPRRGPIGARRATLQPAAQPLAPIPVASDEAPRPAPVRISTARSDFPY